MSMSLEEQLEEAKDWELAEKILVQISSSDRMLKFPSAKIVEYCKMLATEFNTQKKISLDK